MSFWSVPISPLTSRFLRRQLDPDVFGELFLGHLSPHILYATLASALATVIALPCAYALAFQVSPAARRLAVFSLITPYFTSYLVRSYTWKIVLTEQGVINAASAPSASGRSR